MKFQNLPEFIVPPNVAEAKKIQDTLRSQVILTNQSGNIKTIAGVDVGIDKPNNRAHASIVVVEFPSMQVIEQAQAFAPAEFPYVPGYLSFRELPALLNALRMLKSDVDLLMVDGQGIAHPRRFGIACHLGVHLNMPTIGVAKSKLTGTYHVPKNKCGTYVPLMDAGEQIGVVLTSKENCKPLFISPGHKMDIQTGVDITLQCITKYRLPEPTRLADKYSKKEYMASVKPL